MNTPIRPDDVIAAAARSLVAQDPPATLRGRVLERLEAPARSRWVRAAWIGAPAAAAIAVIAALSVTRAPEPPAVSSVDPPRALAGAAVPSRPAPPPLTKPIEPAVAARRRPGARTIDSGPLSEAGLAWRAAAIPALPEPEALAVAVSQPEPVAIALLEVRTLAAPPVTVAPIDTTRWLRDR